MNIEEVIGRYVITHYGNLVLHEEPEFDENRQLWISRLHSDYPIMIHNDLTSERRMRFIKINPLGFVAFDEKMRINRDWTSARGKIVSRIDTYLNMWRAYAENIVISASADRIVELPEVMTALNPIYEILLTLHEDGRIGLEDLVSERRSRKREMKSRQYVALLEGLNLIRRHRGQYVRGNLFVALEKRNPEFNQLVKWAFSEILHKRYPYLREVIALGNLERLIRVGNTVYYPELHAREPVPRDRSTLVKEFALEYPGGIPPIAMRSNLHKLERVEVIERRDSMYQGVDSLRSKMFELQKEMPSPETVWSVSSPA